jgi:hypothetical protein
VSKSKLRFDARVKWAVDSSYIQSLPAEARAWATDFLNMYYCRGPAMPGCSADVVKSARRQVRAFKRDVLNDVKNPLIYLDANAEAEFGIFHDVITSAIPLSDLIENHRKAVGKARKTKGGSSSPVRVQSPPEPDPAPLRRYSAKQICDYAFSNGFSVSKKVVPNE